MNIGIIGFGVMGQIRVKTMQDINEKYGKSYEIKLISEINNISDNYLLYKKGIDTTNNFSDIIDNNDIDAVFVCTPNYLNKEIVIRLLNSRKHVFCEKPPGINLKQLEEMKKTAENNPSLKLMFGFNHRHHDSMIYAKKIIDSGRLGNVLWIRGRYGKSVNEDFCKSWRAKKEFAGGGILLDQGIHMLDLFLMMCGDFDEVKASVSNLYWKMDVEDNVFAILTNKKGQVASLHSTMTQWRHLFSLEIFLEKGHIVVNGLLTNSGSYGKEEMSVAENSGIFPTVSWNKEERTIYNINTSWENEMKMFFDCIDHNTEIPVANTQDAYKLMRLVDMIYEQR